MDKLRERNQIESILPCTLFLRQVIKESWTSLSEEEKEIGSKQLLSLLLGLEKNGAQQIVLSISEVLYFSSLNSKEWANELLPFLENMEKVTISQSCRLVDVVRQFFKLLHSNFEDDSIATNTYFQLKRNISTIESVTNPNVFFFAHSNFDSG